MLDAGLGTCSYKRFTEPEAMVGGRKNPQAGSDSNLRFLYPVSSKSRSAREAARTLSATNSNGNP